MVESKLNKQALDRYTKSISAIILDNFYNEHSSISGQQIVDLTKIKQLNFFVLKVLFSQWQEETKKFKSPYFDYNNENVKQALNTLVNTLSKNISIERDAFAPILENALLDTIHLIFDPKTYFSKEISSINGNNIAKNFKSLTRYIKLNKDAFNAIAEELGEGNIEKDSQELDTLIHKSCEQINLEDNNSEIELFDEILTIDFNDTEKAIADNDLIEENTKIEKEIHVIQKEVKNEEYEEDAPTDNIDDDPQNDQFENTDAINEEFRPVDEKTESHEGIVTEEKENLENTLDPPSAEVREEEVETESIEQPILEGVEENQIEEEKVEASNVNEKFTSDTQTVNEQFEEMDKVTTVAEKHETSPVSELHSSINVNQRYMFLNDLFGGDENEYNAAIESIENCESFDDSVEHLMQNYSRKFQWNMGSDEVKELLKVIFKRFR